jgi:hypothetical protein
LKIQQQEAATKMGISRQTLANDPEISPFLSYGLPYSGQGSHHVP